MTQFANMVGIAVAATALCAETPMPEYQDDRQPGLLRVSGISDTDRVLLDGELIGDGRRLMRFGSKLLVNPGQYTVTIVSAKTAPHAVTVFQYAKMKRQRPNARARPPSPSKTSTNPACSHPQVGFTFGKLRRPLLFRLSSFRK